MQKQQIVWGLSMHLDLQGCNKNRLTSKKVLQDFFKEVCNLINMTPFGEPIIERFGHEKLEGWTGVQLIETSNITVHCDEVSDRVFIDLFSCKPFDSNIALNFSKTFFEATTHSYQLITRK